MKAVLHYNASERLQETLDSVKDLRIVVVPDGDHELLERELPDADVLLHVLAPVNATMIRMARRLKLIQKIGVGVDAIDRVAARQAGIAIANMPGTNTAAVAEHTLALMLAALRRVCDLHAATAMGQGWSLSPANTEALGELQGARVGLIGYGAVPQRVTPALLALGAEPVYWSRSPHPSALAKAVSLDELLATSQIVSLHLPSVPETVRFFDRSRLATLRRGSILINTSRGDLIDQQALSDALASGQVGAAGLDVFEHEPLMTQPFAGCPNVVMTPHVAWLTPQTFQRSLRVIEENCRRIRSNAPLLHQIHY